MSFHLNRTEHYHRHEMDTLGWELTICNALEPEDSPARRLLRFPNTFGNLLLDFLSLFLPARQGGCRVLEVGGGYGYLMRDFLRRKPEWRATMLDLSPLMSQKQKETLGSFDVCFLCEDFFEKTPGFFSNFEVVLMNEILGDFPTACQVKATPSGSTPDLTRAEILEWVRRFHLKIPATGSFTLNVGALRAVDRLCAAGVPSIYLSEHSCEARGPREWLPWLDPCSTGNPEPIQLKGHVEYTIKFSHLEQVARHYGYRSTRGPYADFLPLDLSSDFRYILTSTSVEDDHEEIRHFAQDLFKYEYLILTRP